MKKLRIKDYKGLIVRSNEPIANSLGRLPKGSLYLVEDSGRTGLTLTSEECKCCGLRFDVRGVAFENVTIVGFKENKDRLEWNKRIKRRKGNRGYEYIYPTDPMPVPSFSMVTDSVNKEK